MVSRSFDVAILGLNSQIEYPILRNRRQFEPERDRVRGCCICFSIDPVSSLDSRVMVTGLSCDQFETAAIYPDIHIIRPGIASVRDDDLHHDMRGVSWIVLLVGLESNIK